MVVLKITNVLMLDITCVMFLYIGDFLYFCRCVVKVSVPTGCGVMLPGNWFLTSQDDIVVSVSCHSDNVVVLLSGTSCQVT